MRTDIFEMDPLARLTLSLYVLLQSTKSARIVVANLRSGAHHTLAPRRTVGQSNQECKETLESNV